MNRLACVLLAGLLAAGGCQMERFRSQGLGRAGYGEAFDAGKAVLAQHFSIASADPASGRIVSRPRPLQPTADRLLGRSSGREVATMRIRQEGDHLFADLRVDIQRRDLGAARAMQPVTVDTELPTRTPAQESAAVTLEQDQTWITTGRNHLLERTILADLLKRLAKGK